MMPRLRRALLIGLAFGAGALHLAVVGVLLMLHQRWIIIDMLSLGQAVLVAIAGGAGAMAGRPLPGALAGAAAGVPIAALAVLMSVVPLQGIFIALSPALLNMLTLGFGPAVGVVVLVSGGAVAGLLGAALRLSPKVVRRAIIPGAVAVVDRRRVPGTDPAHAAAIRGDGQRFPRIHLHLGRAEPARCGHHLHPCRTRQRGVRI